MPKGMGVGTTLGGATRTQRGQRISTSRTSRESIQQSCMMRPASAGHASESMPPPPDASPAFAGRSRLPKPASDMNPVSSGLPSPLQQARDVPRLRLLASRELRPSRAVQPPLRFSDTPHPRPCSLALSLSPRPAARSLCCPSPCSFPHPHTAPLPSGGGGRLVERLDRRSARRAPLALARLRLRRNRQSRPAE